MSISNANMSYINTITTEKKSNILNTVENVCIDCSCNIIECAIYEDDLTKIKKKLEKEGEAAVQALYKDKNANITEQSLTSIMQKGFDEFKEKTGRTMSYGEMRELYG